MASAQNVISAQMLGIGPTNHARCHQQHPDADRDEMEHPDHVVGGRVVGLLLVAR